MSRQKGKENDIKRKKQNDREKRRLKKLKKREKEKIKERQKVSNKLMHFSPLECLKSNFSACASSEKSNCLVLQSQLQLQLLNYK